MKEDGMRVQAIHTRTLQPPKDDLLSVLADAFDELPEKSVVAITSKVVALWQGRCVPIPEEGDPLEYKDALATKESDRYLPRGEGSDQHRMHTITNGVLIGASGIDQSNGDGYFVLWPQDPMRAAEELRAFLRERHGVTDLGVIITDSQSTPLRNGAVGITLGYAGFRAQYDYRGAEDVFGRPLKAERLNVADSLASAVNLVMGEGAETTPIALVAHPPHVQFAETEAEDPWLQLKTSLEDDIFRRFFKGQPWEEGDGINAQPYA